MLTYSLGTQKEEREDIDISKLHQGSIDVSAPGQGRRGVVLVWGVARPGDEEWGGVG